MPDLLFVYGSLRSEFDNPHAVRLRAESQFLGPATAPGAIFRIGPYPAFVPKPDGIVHGEVYRLTDPEKTLAHLDDYEGDEYPRIAIRLLAPDAEAWIYYYAGLQPLTERIASGDFTKP